MQHDAATVLLLVRPYRREHTPMMVTCTEEALPLEGATLGMRIYTAEAAQLSTPLVLHLHGGAFVSGSLDAGRAVSISLARAGAVVMSADYPLAPESGFPHTLQTIFRSLISI